MRGKRSFFAAAVLSVVLLAGIAGSASGAEWVYFATTAKGAHYYDKQSVKKTNVISTNGFLPKRSAMYATGM